MRLVSKIGLVLTGILSLSAHAESFTPENYIAVGSYHGTNTNDVGFHAGFKANDKIGARISASPLYGAVFRGSVDYHLSEHFIASVGVSSFHIDAADFTETGTYATIGYFTRFGESFNFGVEFGYEDTFTGATLFGFDLNYDFSESFYAGYKFIMRSTNDAFDTGSYYIRYRF
ncbi:MAG: outer membrane protein [Idiomarinaceae bacterium HL-53]|nr:MAG: outer membrane protein [Idiomarinaceae bacterium HL-53]CUS47678.1 hypothetical protein Ga0003345_0611 [Idiomarinaceae bacterium HL-53]